MLNNFLAYISENCLATGDEPVLAAVSGGIDSVVLADLLHKSKFRTGIVHCNFGLRGKDSDEDERFTEELAQRYGIPFFTRKFQTKDYAEKRGISIQMAARELRYNFFRETALKQGFSLIATGHNADDQIETFFLNLLRGSGVNGLRGIQPRKGNIIRPLLFANRQTIHDYAVSQNLTWREDKSNRENYYLRNRIRNELMPLLNKIMPGAGMQILKSMEFLGQAEKIIDQNLESLKTLAVREKSGKLFIDFKPVLESVAPETFIWKILEPFGFGSSTINNIIQSAHRQPGKVFYSHEYQLLADRNQWILSRKTDSVSYPEPVMIPKGQSEISGKVHLQLKEVEKTSAYTIPRATNIAALDAAMLKWPLVLRNWKKGDTFYPLGMNHRRLVSDFLTDLKIPRTDKERTLVIESAGNIIWVAGYRIDHRYRIKPSTQKILEIVLKGRPGSDVQPERAVKKD
ncbi:MAG: tRNA lysidine(34) synthetase TilS [Bacteroidales bacterium]